MAQREEVSGWPLPVCSPTLPQGTRTSVSSPHDNPGHKAITAEYEAPSPPWTTLQPPLSLQLPLESTHKLGFVSRDLWVFSFKFPSLQFPFSNTL
jgi:hypothetical protein